MKTILVIEDDSNTAHAITVRLGTQGYSVRVAHTFESALLLARRCEFDLFIIDIGLPDFDGITLAEQLLHLPLSRLKPVLFLTGCRNFTQRLRATSLGAFGWLEKPYQPADLLRVVKSALEKRDPSASRDNPFAPLGPLLPKPQVRQKVLVIEDDKPIAASLKLRLENAGYEAILAFDGTQGLRYAKEYRPDLILSDIRMPGGLGFSIFEHLATCEMRDTPVMFLTASRKPGLREAALEMGAADFFEKPFDSGLLLGSIRRTLHHRN